VRRRRPAGTPAARAVRISQRVRLLLDASTITVALGLVWESPIMGVLDPGQETLTTVVAAAYPVSDVLLTAIMCTLLTYGAAGRDQVHLIWLLAGLLSLTGADTVFCLLADSGSISVVSIADLLWTAGFAAIAIAARTDPGGDRPTAADPPTREWLPYALLAGSVLLTVGRWFFGGHLDRPGVALLAMVALLVYLRQFLLLRDKRRLVAQVHDGRERLRHTGLHDAVTGLPNRAGLLELVDAALELAATRPFCVVKLRPAHPQLLDNLDPAETDTVLCELAGRIAGCLPPGAGLARVSQCTFAAVVAGDRDAAVGFAQQVMLAADAPLPTGYRRLHVGMAAGVAAIDAAEPGTSAATLIQHAVIALNSLAALPGGIAVFSPLMLRAQVDHLELREMVVRALRDDPPSDVVTLYEPIVELSTGRLAGIAASAGLHTERYGTVAAGRLIGLAREVGMAQRVDLAVLATAIGQFGRWSQRWPEACGQLWIVGTCAETLAGPGFPDLLRRLLDTAGVPARRLVVEPLGAVDGGVPTDAARGALRLLRGLGVGVVAHDSLVLAGYAAVPDADTGDAEFFDISPVLVERCVADLRARRLVQATAEFAADHGGAAAARGVATAGQHEELLQAGCALARGPLYGTSLGGEEAGAVLAAVAAGSWHTPAGQVAQRHRSSLAWQELRKVISALPIAAFAFGAEGTLDLAEGALLDQLGVTTELVGRPLLDLLRKVTVEGAAQLLRDARRAAGDGTPTVSTVRVRGRWLQVHLCPARDDSGAVTGTVGVAIEVTHRVRAEHALRHSEQRFKSIFADAPVGMAIVAPDTRLQAVNSALAAMLGYHPEALVGRALPSLWHPESPGGSAEQYDRMRTGQIPGYRAERAYRHRDGTPVWTRITVGPLADELASGAVIGVVEDLRPIKQLEVDLRHAQKLEAVGMLAAGIAHEINTPIQFVGDNLNFLHDAFVQLCDALVATRRLCRPVDEQAAGELARLASAIDLDWLFDEVPDAVRQGLDGVSRVATIVNAMRNFGHPDNSDPTLVDIDAAVRDTAAVARNEYKYLADLHLDLGGVPPVPGYPSQFHQVLLNLIVNAAHAIADRGGDRGTIRVRSWVDDTTVHVSVADDGCGMTAETRARIFEPFFTTKEVGRGTGQGLAIVHNDRRQAPWRGRGGEHSRAGQRVHAAAAPHGEALTQRYRPL
jgi:PAS domain S-box-containing protein